MEEIKEYLEQFGFFFVKRKETLLKYQLICDYERHDLLISKLLNRFSCFYNALNNDHSNCRDFLRTYKRI